MMDTSCNEYCFCTLALGEKYCLLARQLAEDLERFSGRPLLVLTDDVSHFNCIGNVIAFKHRQKSVLGYNDKLCVVRKALEMFRTCVMLDADMRVLGPVSLDKEIFLPGISAYRVRSWAYTVEEAMSGPPAIWRTENLRIMKVLRRELDLQQDDQDVPFVVEFLFSITRTNNTDAFLRTWNRLAALCETNRFFIHEGFSIGLAALLNNVPVSRQSFKGLPFFEPTISMQDHLTDGSMSQAQYDALRESIFILKRRWPVSSLGKVVARINTVLRFYRVRLLGLDLLN